MKSALVVVFALLLALSMAINGTILGELRRASVIAADAIASSEGAKIYASANVNNGRLSCIEDMTRLCIGKESPTIDAFIDCGAVAQATCETTAPSP